MTNEAEAFAPDTTAIPEPLDLYERFARCNTIDPRN